jgi:hypothetical protein
MTALILKRTSASRPSGEWNDDDYDVLADGVVVGRMPKETAHGSQPYRRSMMLGVDRADEIIRYVG